MISLFDGLFKKHLFSAVERSESVSWAQKMISEHDIIVRRTFQKTPKVPKCIYRELSRSLAKSETFVKNWTVLGTACPHFVPHCLGEMALLTSRNTNSVVPRRWGTKCMKYYEEMGIFFLPPPKKKADSDFQKGLIFSLNPWVPRSI